MHVTLYDLQVGDCVRFYPTNMPMYAPPFLEGIIFNIDWVQRDGLMHTYLGIGVNQSESNGAYKGFNVLICAHCCMVELLYKSPRNLN